VGMIHSIAHYFDHFGIQKGTVGPELRRWKARKPLTLQGRFPNMSSPRQKILSGGVENEDHPLFRSGGKEVSQRTSQGGRRPRGCW
jgi:hypothetical protein